MASGLGLKHPDTAAMLTVRHACSQSKNNRKIKTRKTSVVDYDAVLSLRGYEQYEAILQGRTPRRLKIFYQDGSVAVSRNFAECFKLLITYIFWLFG